MSAPVQSAAANRTAKLAIKTSRRTELRNITREVAEVVARHGAISGVCHVYIPHTTAGITINEGADPDVARDVELTFDRLVPRDAAGYRHAEGNSDSHVKTALVGTSQTVLVEKAACSSVAGRQFSCANSMARARAKFSCALCPTRRPRPRAL